MTIAVAVRTLSAIVFAADSKLTTYGRVGYDEKGEPIVVSQTYDSATKIIADQTRSAMVAVVGSATLGRVSFMDYVASTNLPALADPEQQKAALMDVAQAMGALRAEYWSDVPEDKWPDTTLLAATSAPGTPSPMLWQINYKRNHPTVDALTHRVYLAGSYRQVFSLLYGYDLYLLYAAAQELRVGDQAVPGEALLDAVEKTVKILKPIEQINPHVMPIQDAMDLAYFLATTQIQMERFLPGEPVCGGPVDVMVLKTSPPQEILWHPGKSLRHPAER